MTDLITIRGFVATSPHLNKLPSGSPVTNFRVASTPRWWDAQQQAWKEGATNWYTVNSFRALAQHANRSIFVGQPVIVTGRLNIKQWSNDDGRKGTSVEIDASAIGHDLNLGTSSFNRAVQPDSQENQQQDSESKDENPTAQRPTSFHQQSTGTVDETAPSQHYSEQAHASDHFTGNPEDTHSLVEGDPRNNAAVSAMV